VQLVHGGTLEQIPGYLSDVRTAPLENTIARVLCRVKYISHYVKIKTAQQLSQKFPDICSHHDNDPYYTMIIKITVHLLLGVYWDTQYPFCYLLFTLPYPKFATNSQAAQH